MTKRATSRNKRRTSGFQGRRHSSSSGSPEDILNYILGLLTIVSNGLTAVAVLKIYADYGFGVAALLAVFLYLILWEVLAELFSAVGHRLPGPLKIIWEIIEQIFEIEA